MFHCMDSNISLSQRGTPGGLHDVGNRRLNLRFPLQIHPTEPNPAVRFRRQDGHLDVLAGMQPNAFDLNRFANSLLLHHGQRLNSPSLPDCKPETPRIPTLTIA